MGPSLHSAGTIFVGRLSNNLLYPPLQDGGSALEVILIYTATCSTALVVDSYRPEIGQLPYGKAFLTSWEVLNTVLLVYQGYKIVTALPKALRNVLDTYKALRTSLKPETRATMDAAVSEAVQQTEQATGVKGDYQAEQYAEFLDTPENLPGSGSLPINFTALDIPGAMNHIKFRDLSVPRAKGIGGCHDAVEWAKIRQVNEAGYTVPIGKTLTEVPEAIIGTVTNHPTIPGVKMVDYKIPAVGQNLKTTGALKQVDPKTIYDPAIWTDAKLEKALKEAIQDSIKKNNGILKTQWSGKTVEGYSMRGFYREGKITTFYFEPL